jgi:hypothetical protein
MKRLRVYESIPGLQSLPIGILWASAEDPVLWKQVQRQLMVLGETFETRAALIWVWPACNRPCMFSRCVGLRRGMLFSYRVAEIIPYQSELRP